MENGPFVDAVYLWIVVSSSLFWHNQRESSVDRRRSQKLGSFKQRSWLYSQEESEFSRCTSCSHYPTTRIYHLKNRYLKAWRWCSNAQKWAFTTPKWSWINFIIIHQPMRYFRQSKSQYYKQFPIGIRFLFLFRIHQFRSRMSIPDSTTFPNWDWPNRLKNYNQSNLSSVQNPSLIPLYWLVSRDFSIGWIIPNVLGSIIHEQIINEPSFIS